MKEIAFPVKQLFPYFILALLTLWSCSLFAQKQGQKLTYSLINELNSEKFRQNEDSDKVNLLVAITKNDDQNSNRIRERLRYGQMGLKLAQKLKWYKGIANTAYYIAQNYKYDDDGLDGNLYNQIALDALDNYDDKQLLSSVYSNISWCYDNERNWTGAIYYAKKAIDVYEKYNPKANLIGGLTYNLGLMYEYSEDYQNALNCFLKAYANLKKGGDTIGMAITTLEAGEMHYRLINYKNSIKYLTISDTIYMHLGDSDKLSRIKADIAEVMKDSLDKKKLAEAAAYKNVGHNHSLWLILASLSIFCSVLVILKQRRK